MECSGAHASAGLARASHVNEKASQLSLPGTQCPLARFHCILLHLEVFRCSDRLDVRALTSKSAITYLKLMDIDDLHREGVLGNVVEYTLKHTRCEDMPLILKFVKEPEYLDEESEVGALFQKSSPILWKMALSLNDDLQQLMSEFDRQVFKHEEESALAVDIQATLTRDLAEKKKELEGEEEARNEEQNNFNSLMHKYFEFQHCPGCGKADSVRFSRLSEDEKKRKADGAATEAASKALFHYKLQCNVLTCQKKWTA